MKNYPLIRTFSIFSIVAFILTGFILSFIISEHIKTDKLDNVQELARITVRTVTRIHLPEYNIGFIMLINNIGVAIMSSEVIIVSCREGRMKKNIVLRRQP